MTADILTNMGITQTLVDSVVKVAAGLVGFGLFFSGAQHAAMGNSFGYIVFLVGAVLLVFAARL